MALIATAISAGFVLLAGPRTRAGLVLIRVTATLAVVTQIVAVALGALPAVALVMSVGTVALPWLSRRWAAVVAGGSVALLLAFFAAGEVPTLRPAEQHGGHGPAGESQDYGQFALTVLLWIVLTIGLGVVARLAVARSTARRWLALPALATIAAGAIAIPAPAAGHVPGTPLMATVTVADRQLPVLVVPGRQGWNLVHIGAEEASVGSTPATARPGTANSWAEVWLPAGASTLSIAHAGATATLEIDTGEQEGGPDIRGPDGPECAHWALGKAIAGTSTPLDSCPADSLTPADAAGLRATVRFLAERGVATVGLLGDVAPRAVEAEQVVRAEAQRLRLTVAEPGRATDPLIIVSGWQTADHALDEIGTGRAAAQGTYLAPWLLNTNLLGQPAGQLLTLRFHPGEAPALGYLAELHARFPGEAATASGYAGWSGTAGQDDSLPRLYAASKLYVPAPVQQLQSTGDGHGTHGGGGWLPNGSIVPVTGPLDAA
jgi:hypothetical protein